MTTTDDPITTLVAPDVDAASTDAYEAEVADVADRLFADVLGALNVFATTFGVRLGWYDRLAEVDWSTPPELAAATGTDARYAREWLEHQTVAGYVEVDDPDLEPEARRYRISPALAEVLTDRTSLSYMGAFAPYVSTLGGHLDQLVDAYRSGAGFGWHDHGDGARCSQAHANRPMFLSQLGGEYLASIPDVHQALSRGGRVADIGCGFGWSSIGVALAYPDAAVDGFDVDGPSIEGARVNAADAGVADRVRFQHVDGGQLDASGYDVALALECIHDMADPVSVLSAMRELVTPDGIVIVMDERVADRFSGEEDPIEQFMYGFSLICCLPDGRNAAESVATGSVMRRPTLERYASAAGFSRVEVLPIENDFFRFYRLESERSS